MTHTLTTATVLNPAFIAGNASVAMLLTNRACTCGAPVDEAYTFDPEGEVEGKRYRCSATDEAIGTVTK